MPGIAYFGDILKVMNDQDVISRRESPGSRQLLLLLPTSARQKYAVVSSSLSSGYGVNAMTFPSLPNRPIAAGPIAQSSYESSIWRATSIPHVHISSRRPPSCKTDRDVYCVLVGTATDDTFGSMSRGKPVSFWKVTDFRSYERSRLTRCKHPIAKHSIDKYLIGIKIQPP